MASTTRTATIAAAVAVILGLLAFSGVHIWQRRRRDAETHEMLMNLRWVADACITYSDWVDFDDPLTPGFPAAAPPTPALDRLGDEPYGPFPHDWTHPTWQALSFAIRVPHHYSYSFFSEGEGGEAVYSVSSYRKVDGDFVVHRRFGAIRREGCSNRVTRQLLATDQIPEDGLGRDDGSGELRQCF